MDYWDKLRLNLHIRLLNFVGRNGSLIEGQFALGDRLGVGFGFYGIRRFYSSVWAAWVEAYKLRGRSVWENTSRASDSIGWRRLLSIREEVLAAAGNEVQVDNLTAMDGASRMAQVYSLYHSIAPVVDWYYMVWSTYHVPKTSFITWLACWDRLNTKAVVSQYNSSIPSNCCLCDCDIETVEHLMFECSFSKQVLGQMVAKLELDVQLWSIQQWKQVFGMARHKNSIVYKVRAAAICCTIYVIWEARNRKLFAGKNHDPRCVLL